MPQTDTYHWIVTSDNSLEIRGVPPNAVEASHECPVFRDHYKDHLVCDEVEIVFA